MSSNVIFFFSSRRRHTRLTCDWSSDVCSSDLSLLEGSLIITPDDPGASEATILRGGSFQARLGLLTIDGNLVASAEGALIRISQEIPFEGACPDCQGWKMCEDCGGTGRGPNAVCAYCRGTGQCTRCGGSGSVTESQ